MLLDKVVDVPVWQVVRVPKVQAVMKTALIPQRQLIEKLVCGRRHSCRDAEADLPSGRPW